MLIMAGVQFTDLNSGLFTQQITRSRTIEVNARTASVGAATYGPIELPTALAALADVIGAITPVHKPVLQLAHREPAVPLVGAAPLDQEALWEGVRRHLHDGDIVLADQGTAFYGMAPRRLPEGVTFVGQPLWASIGYTLPALLGTCTAEPGRRGVLLIGDGAAQLTVQELSTIMGDATARADRRGRQRRLHRGAGDPWPERAVQRHRSVGLDPTPGGPRRHRCEHRSCPHRRGARPGAGARGRRPDAGSP